MGQKQSLDWDAATAETIRAERAAAKLSQAEVVRRSGISRPSYIRYENGERKPDLAQVASIAEALSIPFTTFARRIEDRANEKM